MTCIALFINAPPVWTPLLSTTPIGTSDPSSVHLTPQRTLDARMVKLEEMMSKMHRVLQTGWQPRVEVSRVAQGGARGWCQRVVPGAPSLVSSPWYPPVVSPGGDQ